VSGEGAQFTRSAVGKNNTPVATTRSGGVMSGVRPTIHICPISISSTHTASATVTP
jgi:hypothetical protein